MTAPTCFTDDGTCSLHCGNNIDLTYSRRSVGSAISRCHIAQGTGGAEVAHSIAALFLQNIVSHGDEGVFLAIHSTVLTNHGKAVNIGVNYEGKVMVAQLHKIFDVGKVLLQRFGIVTEVAGRVGIQTGNFLHAELLEQVGQDNAAYRVHAVKSDLKMRLTDSLDIHKLKVLHKVDVLLAETEVLVIPTEMVHVSILKLVYLLGHCNNLVSLLGI